MYGGWVSKLFVFGMGYAAGHLAALMEERGWSVTGTTRDGRGGTVRFDDRERVEADNLLDQRYAASSYSALWIYPGAPRTVRASLRMEI